MIDRVQTKLAVRARLQGCWGRLFLACVIPSVAPLLLQYFVGNVSVDIPLPSGMSLQITAPSILAVSMALSLFVVLPMQVMLSGVLMRFLGQHDAIPAIAPVFSCFSEGYAGLLKGMIWYWLKTELWGILALASQVVAFMLEGYWPLLLPLAAWIWQINRIYAYCMTPYIVAERPGISGREALRLSCEMTRGRRWELIFALGLSFFGWMLLGVLTVGIAMIYVLPYTRAVEAAYYLQMRPKAWGPLTLEDPIGSQEDDLYIHDK